MSLLDIPDVFIGSTDDGHTFVILNRRIRDADRLLTDAGFLPREHHGHRLYLLPPGIAQDVHDRAGVAMSALLATPTTSSTFPGPPAGVPTSRQAVQTCTSSSVTARLP
ncbi:hypothetical protein [Streptomyces althioticus]|uniref:hypothetical protein n=1 Tax=Streptomyces althioticus TaxID=83380 RepID=UPI0036F6C70E